MSDAKSAADFTFPLNVYAHLLELEEGRVNYLHYGLFAGTGDTAGAAQQRAAELLWHYLPAPCKTLDVGIGLGTTLARLLATGYSATGITPDEAQIRQARNRSEGALPVVPSRLESFATDAGSWQLILFQESAQYIDSIDLFESADRLLTENGEIVIMDEFSLLRDRPGYEPLHYLPHFLSLAERNGFSLQDRLDLTSAAAPTLDWLLNATARHAKELHDELGVSEEQIVALNDSNRRYAENYAQGRYGYFLLRFKRTTRPRWRTGRIGSDQAAAMRDLFASVFGHAMSPAHWQWKYGGGQGAGVGVWRQDGQLIAHYGGTSRDILMFGSPSKAFQACDLMVAPAERGSLSRKGPVFLAGATFLEHELGYGAPHLLGIGFPNEKAYRLPAHLGLYAGALARIQEVSWPALRTRPALRQQVREIDPLAQTSVAIMNTCWANMRTSMDSFVIGVRDAAYLQHRYAAHPDFTYRFFHVRSRFGRRSQGMLILRVIETEAGNRCELLDVVGALATIPQLIHQARRIAAALGCVELFTWVADNMLPYWALPPEAVVQDINVIVPGNNWTAAPPNEQFSGKWWLTGGDTDFH